jgi:hypothetical protein
VHRSTLDFFGPCYNTPLIFRIWSQENECVHVRSDHKKAEITTSQTVGTTTKPSCSRSNDAQCCGRRATAVHTNRCSIFQLQEQQIAALSYEDGVLDSDARHWILSLSLSLPTKNQTKMLLFHCQGHFLIYCSLGLEPIQSHADWGMTSMVNTKIKYFFPVFMRMSHNVCKSRIVMPAVLAIMAQKCCIQIRRTTGRTISECFC